MKLLSAFVGLLSIVGSAAPLAASDGQYLFDLAEQVVVANVVDVGELELSDKTYVAATLAVAGIIKGSYPLGIAVALLPGPGISYRDGAQQLRVGDSGLFLLGRQQQYKGQPIAMAMIRFVPDSDLSDQSSKNRLLAMAVASKIKAELTRLQPMSKSDARALLVPGTGSCVVQLGFKNGMLELADIKTSSGDLRFDQQLIQAAYASLAGVDTLLDGLVELTFENGAK